MFKRAKALQLCSACVFSMLVAGCGENVVAQQSGYLVGYWTELQGQPRVVSAYQDSAGRTCVTPVLTVTEYHLAKVGAWQIHISNTPQHAEGQHIYAVNSEGRAGHLRLQSYTDDFAIPVRSELTDLSRVF